MSHRLACPNGHVLVVPPKLEGKRIRCPKCQALLEVPIITAVEEEEEIITETVEEETPKPPPLPKDVINQSQPSWREEENENNELGIIPIERAPDPVSPYARSRRREDDWEDDWDDDDEDALPQTRRLGRGRDGDENVLPRQSKKLYRQQMKATRLGMMFFYNQIIVYVVMLVGFFAGLMCFPFLPLAMFANYFVAPILGIIGGAFIVRIPPKTGARPLAIATLVLESIPLGCLLLSYFARTFPASLQWSNTFPLFLGLSALAALCTLAGFTLFLLFIKRLTYYFHGRVTADQIQSSLFQFLGSILLGPFFIGFTFVIMLELEGNRGLLALIVFIELLGWMFLLIRQLFDILELIARVRKSI
jgi:hypothetical protein